MGILEGIKILITILFGAMVILYIAVMALYALGVIIGFWALLKGQTEGLGLIAMCAFLLLVFVYLPAKDWSRNY